MAVMLTTKAVMLTTKAGHLLTRMAGPADIVGFNHLSSTLPTMELILMLNQVRPSPRPSTQTPDPRP
eukprot:2144082-Rhodomonas_salina.1